MTTTTLSPFEYKGITVMVGKFAGQDQFFTSNGQYLVRRTKEEMIQLIDISLEARSMVAARQAARLAEFNASMERDALVKRLRRAGKLQVLNLDAGNPLVRASRCYNEIREDVYDAARNSSRSAPSFCTFEAALMGGEPYADWN